MGYIKAYDILPANIIEEIQNYIEGEIIYIPKRNGHKKSWGEGTDTKSILSIRNSSIYNDYHKGISIKELSQKYFLVEKSISRILQKEKVKNNN